MNHILNGSLEKLDRVIMSNIQTRCITNCTIYQYWQYTKLSLQVLDNGSILSEPACYHQFCRLLAKLKCNYQLNEIVDIEGYEGIIDTIAKFTISSLEVKWPRPSISNVVWVSSILCGTLPHINFMCDVRGSSYSSNTVTNIDMYRNLYKSQSCGKIWLCDVTCT